MGQGVWKGSDGMNDEDELRDVIRQGTLTLGFIGLAECLVALTGKHHGESDESQELGLKIVRHMRERMDQASEQYDLNFSLIATPAEGLSGRFTRLDAQNSARSPASPTANITPTHSTCPCITRSASSRRSPAKRPTTR